jgi:RNA polymerase sigma-70 factor (ECF subfamily)
MAATPEILEERLERHRPELVGYCYRMLGSPFEAEDATQETLLRAWRGIGGFQGRAALRSWLHRIATNVCFDMLDARRRRARPMDFGEPGAPVLESLRERPETTWIEPIPETRALRADADPASVAEARETLRLAVIGALQHLPPRQRAVLILREVLQWRAAEVADLLGSSEASVNSALQRARASLAAVEPRRGDAPTALDDDRRELVDRYVDAFERYDMDALVALLHEDATLSMPPYDLWLTGHADIAAWMTGPGAACRGSRMVPVEDANGAPAFGQYRRSASGAGHEAWALQVLEISGDRIVGLNSFLGVERLFGLFGLPLRLGAEDPAEAVEHG